jgi:MFS family permease
MYQVAVGWLALQMTDSAFFVGLSGFVGGIPLLVLSLPIGVLIDRFDGRIVLLIAQVIVMCLAALFAILVAFDALHPWSMLLLVGVYGAVMSFVFPSRNTLVPALVERRDLTNAVALNASTQNVTRVIGPSLSGVLIAVLGISGTFAVAAALQIAAVYTTVRIPRLNLESASRGRMDWDSLTIGFRIVARDRFLSMLIVMAMLPTVLVVPYLNLMPVFARDEMDLGSTGLGLLLGAAGLGAVSGSLWVARWEPIRRHRHGQSGTALAFAALVIAFTTTPTPPVAMLILFGAGWMSAAYFALNQTVLQLYVDDTVRGRVFSIYMLTWGMLPVGQLAVGTLADFTGTPAAVAIASVIAFALIIVIARMSTVPAMSDPELDF